MVEEEERTWLKKRPTLAWMHNTLSPEECRKLQPDIELDILGAVHYHCDAHLYPNKLMKVLGEISGR